ncbi:hypothetical protein [Terrarubrum flagellatum]|uniref:hypothetical protein n=1 Tax=Terrirubrum flagellatum TaxID=2895980 RepID=UPI003144E431
MTPSQREAWRLAAPRLQLKRFGTRPKGINVDGVQVWGNPFQSRFRDGREAPYDAARSLVDAIRLPHSHSYAKEPSEAELRWAETALYARWIAGALDELPGDRIWDQAFSSLALWPHMAPALDEIRAINGTRIVSVAPRWMDSHGDVLRAVAAGWEPMKAIGLRPGLGGYRRYEELTLEKLGRRYPKLKMRGAGGGRQPW